MRSASLFTTSKSPKAPQLTRPGKLLKRVNPSTLSRREIRRALVFGLRVYRCSLSWASMYASHLETSFFLKITAAETTSSLFS